MSQTPPDTSWLWCLEHLAANGCNTDVVEGLLKELSRRGVEFHGTAVLVRISLNHLAASKGVTADTIDVLNSLTTLINELEPGQVPVAVEELLPPPDLLVHLKTDLVADSWRNVISPKKTIDALFKNFGRVPDIDEKERFEELKMCSGNPAARLKVDRLLERKPALGELVKYVESTKNLLGPTVLQIVQNDINNGAYVPGSASAVDVEEQQTPRPRIDPKQLYRQVLEKKNEEKKSVSKSKAADHDIFIVPANPSANLRRSKTKWRDDEVEALLQGLKEYGTSWATILANYKKVFHEGRTSVDLKDKYRNMLKSSTTKEILAAIAEENAALAIEALSKGDVNDKKNKVKTQATPSNNKRSKIQTKSENIRRNGEDDDDDDDEATETDTEPILPAPRTRRQSGRRVKGRR